MPNPDTDPVDFVLLGNPPVVSPGPARIVGASSPRKWQEHQGYGWGGGWLWFTGRQLAEFTITLTLQGDDQWAAYEQDGWKAMTDPPPYGRKAGWLAVWHPWLEAQEIDKCVIMDRGQPQQTEQGLWTIEIKCKQWNRPRLQLSKPSEPDSNEPTDPREQQIAALTDRFNGRLSAVTDGNPPAVISGRLAPSK